MATIDTAQMAARVPWLSREGKFRFELGLRQSSGDFFKASADHDTVLAERTALLETHPERHAAMLDEGAELMRATRSFAQEVSGVSPQHGRSPLDECIQLGKCWEPDFLLLKPAADGLHRLVGGCICFPSSWDLHEKLGLPVEAIHAPVPTVNQNLGTQVSAFLARIRPGVIWERWNWGMAAVDSLNHHPALNHRRLHAGSTLADTWLRLEHQAFRSLDAAGGLLFAIRITVLPLSNLLQQRPAALRLAELLETMPDDIAAYKSLADARHALARQLRAAAA
jgi:dimethylamine monooxygenase subunit A